MFLTESLELWRIAGTVEAGAPPAVAEIRAKDGIVIAIERMSADGMPFRWMVRRHSPSDTREARPRPCGSLVGVLNAIRSALGVNRGTAVRIAPSPTDK